MAIEEAEDGHWRDNYQNAWAALRMIRETIETLGHARRAAFGRSRSMLYGPEPIHGGEAISEALSKLLAKP